jgi:hypothetical protein
MMLPPTFCVVSDPRRLCSRGALVTAVTAAVGPLLVWGHRHQPWYGGTGTNRCWYGGTGTNRCWYGGTGTGELLNHTWLGRRRVQSNVISMHGGLK